MEKFKTIKVGCPYCYLENNIPTKWIKIWTTYNCFFCDESFIYGKSVKNYEARNNKKDDNI